MLNILETVNFSHFRSGLFWSLSPYFSMSDSLWELKIGSKKYLQELPFMEIQRREFQCMISDTKDSIMTRKW